jgi:hypothetical protein
MRATALALLLSALVAPTALAAGVSVKASIAPQPTRFGDVVHSTLRITGPAVAGVEGGFSPFRVLRSSSSHVRTSGGVVTTWRFELQCLEAVCAPGPGRRTVVPAPVRVRVGADVVRAPVPAVQVDPRVSAAQVASPEASFMHPTAPVAPTYRFAPGTTRVILFAVAAVLALAGCAILLPALRPRRRGRPELELDPVAHALMLVRAARDRPVPDRRRALGLLARTLRRQPETARAASDLAWSEPEPDRARMTELADRVEAAP